MEKKPNRVEESIIYSLLTALFHMISSFSIFIVLARIPSVSISEFGIFTYSFVISQLLSTCCEFGMGTFLAKNGLKTEYDGSIALNNCISIHIIFMLAGWLAAITLTSHFLELSPLSPIVLFSTASIFLQTSSRFFHSIFQAQRIFSVEMRCNAVELTVLAISLGIAALLTIPSNNIALILCLSRLLSLIYTLRNAQKHIPNIIPAWKTNVVKSVLRDCLPLAATFATSLAMTNLDTIIMGALVKNQDAIALYQASLRIVMVSSILPIVLTKSLLPFIRHDVSQYTLKNDQKRNIIFDLSILNKCSQQIGVLISIFTYYQSSNIIILLYGDSFSSAEGILKILSATIFLRFGVAYNLYMISFNHHWLRFWLATINLLILLVSSYILINYFGSIGAAYASILSYSSYLLSYWTAMYCLERKPFLGTNPIFLVLYALPYAALMQLMQDSNMLVVIFLSIVYTVLITCCLIPTEKIRKILTR